MKSATSSVEFSFNNTMYKQTERGAMGSPFGPALTNTFVGYCKEKLFSQTQKPQHTLDMLTTRLPSSIIKLKQMNHQANSTAFIHPSDSSLKKRKRNVYRFLIRRKNRYSLGDQLIPETHFHRPVFALAILYSSQT